MEYTTDSMRERRRGLIELLKAADESGEYEWYDADYYDALHALAVAVAERCLSDPAHAAAIILGRADHDLEL